MCSDLGFQPLRSGAPMSRAAFFFAKHVLNWAVKKLRFKSKYGAESLDQITSREWFLTFFAERNQGGRGRNLLTKLFLCQAAKLSRNLQAFSPEGPVRKQGRAHPFFSFFMSFSSVFCLSILKGSTIGGGSSIGGACAGATLVFPTTGGM